MHIAFLSNPASGQLNCQLSTAEELVLQGHSITLLSAQSCSTKIDQFRAAQLPSHQARIHFISLGSNHAVDDFTPFIQPRMHRIRKPPGDPTSLQTCIEADLGPAHEHAATALTVRDHLLALDPDMICVDIMTAALITGVRLTKRKFILTMPCSPGVTAVPGFFQPHAVAGNREGSWGSFFENITLTIHEYLHSRTHPDRRAKHALVKRLGLTSYGATADSSLIPPHWEDANCVAGVHFNTPGLVDCSRQASKIVFVGAGVSPPQPQPQPQPQMATTTGTVCDRCPELAWMDEAEALGHDVVYINMGSLFIWEEAEFGACIEGLKAAYHELKGRVRFLIKVNSLNNPISHSSPTESSLVLPAYIHRTPWIPNQGLIYTHGALAAFIHHGGGNSFNEAVHFGIPQLVLSQWSDTHEYAFYAAKFGLGLRSAHPPAISAADVCSKICVLLGRRRDWFRRNCREWALRSHLAGGVGAAARVVLFHAERERMSRSDSDNEGEGERKSVPVVEAAGDLTPPMSPVMEKTGVDAMGPGGGVG